MLEAKDLTKPGEISAALVTLSQSLSKLEKEVQGVVAAQKEKQSLNAGGETTSKSADTGHSFCGEAKCSTCAPIVNKAYQIGQAEILAIPGVKEAMEYNQEMAKMGYQGESWYKVPQVANAVQLHQLMLTPAETQVS